MKWWHGFAINVDVDLEPYQRINPCGMGSALVTRMADHVQPCPRVRVVADATGAEARRWWAQFCTLDSLDSSVDEAGARLSVGTEHEPAPACREGLAPADTGR